MSIFGTRPEAIKMAPIIQEMERRKNEIESVICVTAQHREMLDSVLETFNIIPDYDLNIMKKGQTLDSVTGIILQGLNGILEKEQPDMVLVHGDTTTTFASALAAFYHKIPVGHVEAGLRTHNLYSPYPEEANRQMVGNIAELHFTPTMQSLKNLLQENKDPEKIYLPRINVSTSYVFAHSNDFFAYHNNYNYYVNYYRNTFQHGGISMNEILVPVTFLKSK